MFQLPTSRGIHKEHQIVSSQTRVLQLFGPDQLIGPESRSIRWDPYQFVCLEINLLVLINLLILIRRVLNSSLVLINSLVQINRLVQINSFVLINSLILIRLFLNNSLVLINALVPIESLILLNETLGKRNYCDGSYFTVHLLTVPVKGLK